MTRRRKASRKPLFVALAILLIVGAAAAVFFLNRDTGPSDADKIATSAAKNPKINYGPPTDEEKQQAEDRKDQIVKDQEQAQSPPPTDSNGKKKVTVTVTSGTNPTGPDVTITGFAQGVVEDGGTCTATLTKGGEKKTASSKGFADVSTTNCPPMAVQLTPGTWELAFGYNSANASGSASVTLTVK